MRSRTAAFAVLVVAVSIRSPIMADQAATKPDERVLGTVADFAANEIGPYRGGHLEYWRWTDAVREQAKSSTKVEVVRDPAIDAQALRVVVSDPAIYSHGAVPLLRLAPFYPPEADVLRLRVKVVSGKLRAFVGGPTAYYANSDVYSEIKQVEADATLRWTTLDFSLNHPLWRNFRRSGLSTDAPRNYYNRWAQEPIGIFIDPGTNGEFLIERVEIVACGEGRPFPTFAPQQVRQVKSIVDFSDERFADPSDDWFTLYMAAAETEWFAESWKRERPLRFVPAELSVVDDEHRDAKVLVSRGRVAEEVHCAGLHTSGTPEANALQITVSHHAPDYRNTVVGVGPAEALDFLVFVAPAGKKFPSDEFAASAELRSHVGPGFDYQLSYQEIRDRQDVDFAVYQTRRYLKPNEWTTLVLPAADFTCIYGSGTYRERYLQHQPLTCDDVTAVAWLPPWCRIGQGNSDVTIRIAQLAFVAVPGTPQELRSFWQIDDVGQVRWIEGEIPRGRTRHMLLPGDAAPLPAN